MPRVDAAEMLTEKKKASKEDGDESVEHADTEEPKKKKSKKQKVGFRDRKV